MVADGVECKKQWKALPD